MSDDTEFEYDPTAESIALFSNELSNNLDIIWWRQIFEYARFRENEGNTAVQVKAVESIQAGGGDFMVYAQSTSIHSVVLREIKLGARLLQKMFEEKGKADEPNPDFIGIDLMHRVEEAQSIGLLIKSFVDCAREYAYGRKPTDEAKRVLDLEMPDVVKALYTELAGKQKMKPEEFTEQLHHSMESIRSIGKAINSAVRTETGSEGFSRAARNRILTYLHQKPVTQKGLH